MLRVILLIAIVLSKLNFVSCANKILKVQDSQTMNTGTESPLLPQVVALYADDPTGGPMFFCSATFISPKRALTARHCFCKDGLFDNRSAVFTYTKDNEKNYANGLLIDETVKNRDEFCNAVLAYETIINVELPAEPDHNEMENHLRNEISNRDVAAIEFNISNEFLSISEQPALPNRVYSIMGYGRPPLSEDTLEIRPTKTFSMTSAISEVSDVIVFLGQKRTFLDDLQVRDYYNGSIYPGDSGSPLYDQLNRNKIVGIASSGFNIPKTENAKNIFMNLHSVIGKAFFTNATSIPYF